MATANDIIKRALRQCHVIAAGETPSYVEAQDALDVLNDLLESWSNDQLMIYQRVNRSKALTLSDGQYTIGSGGDIDTTRPLRIDSAYCQDSDGHDSPITIINNDQWSRISDKDLATTYPIYLYYRPNFPLGQINLYPEPGTGITLYLEVWDQLSSLAALTTTVSLPPGYERMLCLGLALELCAEYHPGPQIEATLERRFQNAKEFIQDVNNINVPEATVDTMNGSAYSITGGEWML